jgi:hypothetical protein
MMGHKPVPEQSESQRRLDWVRYDVEHCWMLYIFALQYQYEEPIIREHRADLIAALSLQVSAYIALT